MTQLLKFTHKNHKLGKDVYTLNLPAGHSCPFARECMSKADRETGKIKDGKYTTYRCFSASQEALYPNVRDSRWGNLEILKDAEDMTGILLLSLPRKALIVRPHVSGDFFSQAYFDAWIKVAKARPDVLVYAYTKAVRYWVRRLKLVGDGHTPGEVANFVLTASRGGRHDCLIDEYGLRSAVVVYSFEDAQAQGLEIDHDDSHARAHGDDFALIIHGPQPAGSEAAKAIAALRAQGEWGYGEMADKRRRLALAVV